MGDAAATPMGAAETDDACALMLLMLSLMLPLMLLLFWFAFPCLDGKKREARARGAVLDEFPLPLAEAVEESVSLLTVAMMRRQTSSSSSSSSSCCAVESTKRPEEACNKLY